jgi:hypothetical protein
MDADGACWTVPNAELRMSFNWTLGRRKSEDRTEDQSGGSGSIAGPGDTPRPFKEPGSLKDGNPQAWSAPAPNPKSSESSIITSSPA